MTDDAPETTGTRVRRAMAAAKVTQVRAAAAISVSQGQLSRRLLGRIPFRADELATIAHLCGVPAGSLIVDLDREPVSVA